MKRPTYIHGITGAFAALILLSGCEKEPDAAASANRSVAFEVVVAAAAAPQSRADGVDPPQIAGSSNADRVRILVYKNASGSTVNTTDSMKTFLFDQQIAADAHKDAGTENWIARGSFSVESTATYRIWGIAYNSADEALLSSTYTGTSYYNAPITVLPPPAGSEFDYITPELFKGPLLAAGSAAEIIRGSDAAASTGKIALHGDLYRVSGRSEVELNNIPANIVSLALLVEKFTTEVPLTDDTAPGNYLLGQPTAVALGTFRVASTAEFTAFGDGRGRTATLTADLLKTPFETAPQPSGSAYFVDATDDTGATVRYMIRAADKWIYTPWIGILDLIVESNMFRVPENYRLYIHGDFEKLKTGNVLIDARPITDEYFGGVLDPA